MGAVFLRKLITALACASTIAVQAGNVFAANTAARSATTTKKLTKTIKTVFHGPLTKCHQWGPIQLDIYVTKTVTGTGAKAKVKLHVDDVTWPTYPDHTPKSKYINASALPLLRAETLTLQSAKLENISGATHTTVSWQISLQAALTQALKP